MNYRMGDRLVLQSEVKTYNETISDNIVCSLVSQQNDDLVIVRYGTDEDTKKPKIIGVPLAMLRSATEADLKRTDYRQLLPNQFYAGQRFKVGNIKTKELKKGDILTVSKVELFLNENKDLITFKHENMECSFVRNFVDMYFDKYDEEYEAKLGDEVIVNDMKTAPRSYYLSGARMLTGSDENQKVVFITQIIDVGAFEVEDMNGIRTRIKIDELMPIINIETLIRFPLAQRVPAICHVGKKFKANEWINNNFLLKKRLQYGDIIKIIAVDKIYPNINEDLFEVKKVDDNEPFYLSFAELKGYFKPFNEDQVEQLEDLGERTYINVGFDKELQEAQQEDNFEIQEGITIHELSIDGFRFKIDGDTFTIDGKEYRKDDLNQLIGALTKLKGFV